MSPIIFFYFHVIYKVPRSILQAYMYPGSQMLLVNGLQGSVYACTVFLGELSANLVLLELLLPETSSQWIETHLCLLFLHKFCAQLCPTLCNPMDCSLSGSSVLGIFQTRILERVVISSRGYLPNPGIEPASFCISRLLYPLSHLESLPPLALVKSLHLTLWVCAWTNVHLVHWVLSGIMLTHRPPTSGHNTLC